MRQFVRRIHWGWSTDAQYVGCAKHFSLSIPNPSRAILIKGVRYNDQCNRIEIFGDILGEKNLPPQYNDKQSPETTPCLSGLKSDGRADGAIQSNQPEERAPRYTPIGGEWV